MTTEVAAAAKWEVRTPVQDYNGVTYGQVFRDGKCVVEDEDVARVLQEDFHYTVTPTVQPATPPATPEDRFRGTRPAHPIEDAPGRVAPFYPRDTNFRPGADPSTAIPLHTLEVRDAEVETAAEVTDDD